MFKTSCLLGFCMVCLPWAPAARAQERVGSRRSDADDAAYNRGYEAGYAAALRSIRQRPSRRADDRPGYVSEYTPYSPYAAQNRPRTSIPPEMAAHRSRTDIRGRNEMDDYLDYPAAADYHHRRGEDLPPRGRIYDPGDFRDEQGGIYGNRGVLMWTDRYDAGDYANKFWNTHRNNVYAGQRVWNTNNGDQ